ncbi:PEP/pyruvate-binding domain-containing protein [Nakamurella deserti]|uniref:PEP/pyruvate-binding domain-containing protein n=1 Tax=Nakamurella deserti TaxID=2164074 RepID=UPI000DBE0637|nr:PEP/pyruvate-binding domain-containing protein [Nakamurella deserti]
MNDRADAAIGAPLHLTDISTEDTDRVGAKAARLGHLTRAGYPVPAGCVFPVGFPADRLPDLDWPALLSRVGPGPYAVRSSGVSEDGAERSFAGMFTTGLDVAAADLPAAVVACLQSADSPRVLAYDTASSAAGATVAVIVQQMVDATAAGVAFTAHPVSGDRDIVLVSAVRGLGDRLADGQVTPQEWAVDDDRATLLTDDGSAALTGIDAVRVAGLAKRVEADQGMPQDIEWALADGVVHLLQARPITALAAPRWEAVPVPVDVPPGYWERDATHSPTPWSPMTGSVFFDARNEGMRSMCQRFGLLTETMEFRQIGGWDYLRVVPLGGRDRAAPPTMLLPLLIRLVPAMRARHRVATAARDTDLAGQLIEKWYMTDRPALEAAAAALLAVDLPTLGDRRLAAHLRAAAQLFGDGTRLHFLLTGPINLAMADLAFTCRELLGWSDLQVFALVSGLSVRSTGPAHALAEVAALAGTRPDVGVAIRSGASMAELADLDPEFGDALGRYQSTYGARALRYELEHPTMAEVPEITLRALAAQLDLGYDPRTEVDALSRTRQETATDARRRLTGAARERFETALARASRAYPVREDNETHTTSVPLAVLRYGLLELARRLLLRSAIGEPSDIFFLTLTEALDALHGTDDGGTRAATISRRRAERRWILDHPGPASYGVKPPPPPDFTGLPGASRFHNTAMVWAVDQIFAASAAAENSARPSGDVLTGTAASAGRATGPVRIIHDESQFALIRPGDVLVCPVTSPVWSVLFPSICALVTDTGGILSHPAIIAREYRLPAVVATGNATSVLAQGQLVTVDGTTGLVHPHP